MATASLLLQRHGALPVCRSTSIVSHGPASVPPAWAHQYSRQLDRDYGLRASSPLLIQYHQLPHSGKAPALILERGLRNGPGAIHPGPNVARVSEPEARKVQCDSKGWDCRQKLLRRSHCATLCRAHLGECPCPAHPPDSVFFL